jgi:hypothetical protein
VRLLRTVLRPWISDSWKKKVRRMQISKNYLHRCIDHIALLRVSYAVS